MFGFLLSMDMPHHCIPKDFNPNACLNEISGGYRYDTSNSKGIIIKNPFIWVAQELLTCGLFAREDNLNMSLLSKLYFL